MGSGYSNSNQCKGLSFDKKSITTLVSGFVREEIEEGYKLIFPNEIKHLIVEILSQIGFFSFNTSTPNMDVITDNGGTFRASKRLSGFPCAGDSNGRKSGCCMIKVKKLSNAERRWLTFGITTGISNIESNKWIYQWCFQRTDNTYYINSDGKGFESGIILAQFSSSKWNEGDIILMEWNSLMGNLKYEKNNEEMGAMSIKKDLTYYPCVCRSSAGAVEVEIVQF